MAKRWMSVTLLGCCLAASPVVAQGPVSEPMPCGPSGSERPAIPGPLAPPYTPEGPPDALGLPANTPNAFDGGPPGSCCPRVYADIQYLAWWFKNPHLPGPIVTSSAGPASATSGALSDPNGTTLVGNNTLKYPGFSGGRATLGFFLDDRQQTAFEATGFIVGQGSANATALSGPGGGPVIATPFTNAQTGNAAALQYAAPGTQAGGMTVSSSARLFGGEGNFVCNYPGCRVACIPIPFSFLIGGRYLNLDEQLDLSGFSNGVGAGTVSFLGANQPVGNGAVLTSLDSFHTRNQFYGGQVGARVGWSFGSWFIGGQAKIAAGNMNEQLSVNGSTTLSVPGAQPVTALGHLYANAANIATTTHDVFAYVPEGEARLGYRFNSWMLGYVGYNFLYISRVARPGNQIDTTVDPRQAPASPAFQPAFAGNSSTTLPLAQSSFWAQGINVGLEITY